MDWAEQLTPIVLAQTTQPAAQSAAWWQFLMWGMLGGLMVDALEIVKLVKEDATNWKKFASAGYLVAELLRVLVGGGLATALVLCSLNFAGR